MPHNPDTTGRTCAERDPPGESETRFRDLADLLPQIVFELDENLKFTFFNWFTIKITGYAYDDLSHTRTGILDIIRESDRHPVELFFHHLQQEITSGHIECGIVTHDGREIPGIIYASPIIGEKRIAGIHGVIVDVAEKIRLERALESTNQKLNMMNSVTRHDVLNSITGVLGLCDMLEGITTDTDARAIVSEIHGQVIKIKDLIIFTKDYQSVGVKAPQWQGLCHSIRSAASAIGRDTVQVNLPGTDAEIYADPFFGRVFYNLIDNSFRHGGSVRNISVETEVNPEGVLIIRYRDDGTGVSPGEKERIFEQGFGKNTGFGLFIIREILGITGLTIREAGTFGSGVLFEISVPKAAWKPLKGEECRKRDHQS
jgi:PAS domain S-box-containing protein